MKDGARKIYIDWTGPFFLHFFLVTVMIICVFFFDLLSFRFVLLFPFLSI